MILTVGVIIIVFVWFPGIDALNATRSRTYQSCIRVCRAKFDPRRDGYQQFPEDYHHHDSNGFHQTSRMRTLVPDWIKLAKNWERERGIEKKETITFERLWWNWPVDSIRMNIAERWYKGVSQLRQARMGPLFGRESRDISSLRPDEHRWPRWICGHDHARDKDQESSTTTAAWWALREFAADPSRFFSAERLSRRWNGMTGLISIFIPFV